MAAASLDGRARGCFVRGICRARDGSVGLTLPAAHAYPSRAYLVHIAGGHNRYNPQKDSCASNKFQLACVCHGVAFASYSRELVAAGHESSLQHDGICSWGTTGRPV
eukprot:scaffold4902_cov377-Prasinococcus_capsulatus_cf.AAC.4